MPLGLSQVAVITVRKAREPSGRGLSGPTFDVWQNTLSPRPQSIDSSLFLNEVWPLHRVTRLPPSPHAEVHHKTIDVIACLRVLHSEGAGSNRLSPLCIQSTGAPIYVLDARGFGEGRGQGARRAE